CTCLRRAPGATQRESLTRPRTPPSPTRLPYTTLVRSIARVHTKTFEGAAACFRRSRGHGGMHRAHAHVNRIQEKRRALQVRVERSEEHTSEFQSPYDLVCRLLLEKKNKYLRRQDLGEQ